MIIWFDSNMSMHVDKSSSAENSFALAKYVPKGYHDYNVYFKANAVVSGNVLLLTHQQVTAYASKLFGCRYSDSGTIRKHFFNDYLKSIETNIFNYLRKDKGYKKDICLRFRIGVTTIDNFDWQGYGYLKDSDKQASYNSLYSSKFIIIEKKI